MMKKFRLKYKYKVLIIYLLVIIPTLVWAWVETTNHIYNIMPFSIAIFGVLEILILDWYDN